MISSGPHQTIRSNRELMQMPAVTLRLWGQSSRGPRGVPRQSFERISAPMAPPPTSHGIAPAGWSPDGVAVGNASEERVELLTLSMVDDKSRDRSDLAT